MVREAPAAWSCFFILHIISNPDTKKKPPPGLSTQLCAPLEFGGFVQRLHIPDQSHPPCLLSRVAWMMSLGPCSSSSGGSRSAPRSRARAAGMSLSMTHRVANIPTVNTHPPPLPPHHCIAVFVSLSAPSHLHDLLVVVGFACVSVCVSNPPAPFNLQLGLEVGRKEETHVIRL